MKKLITITAFIFLLCPAMALSQIAESKTSPETIQKIAPDRYYYNYNIAEIQKDPDGDGPLPPETFYQYNYVEIKGKPTKAKVLAAINAANDTTEADADTAVDLTASGNDMEASVFYGMSKAQLNSYVDNNWTNLTDSKATFKKLLEEVYDLEKRLGYK